MEADTVEIKNEPRCESDPKISDGIDHSGLLFTWVYQLSFHSEEFMVCRILKGWAVFWNAIKALEGMVNMCDSTKPSSPSTSEIVTKPTAEESEEIAAKWTDDQIQKEIDKVGKMGETDEPKCAICKRTFTSVAYLKSHMRAHKEPLRCRG